MMKNQSTNKSASDSTLLEFFKIFIPDSGSLHMVIPPAFVKYLNGTFPKTATIKDHMGKSWRVTVRKMDDLVFFKNGWKDFVDYHSLEYGDLLTFQYDGQCTFDVKIYFKNGCKKVAEAAHSVPIVEAVVAEARNSVPILKVKEEPVGEEEYVKPSISNKRKRSEVGSKNVRKRRSIAARNRGRPRNASNSEEHVGPTRPFFERTMKRWSNKTIVEEPSLHYMDLSEIENFTTEPCNTIPVGINQEVGRYIQLEYSQFRKQSGEIVCGQYHSSSANQEPKYIHFLHEEVDSQQNDRDFQEEDFQENNHSEGADMDMTNELPISQSQEILYLEYRPLRRDIEDTWNSANMDTTKIGGNSFDEENNMEQREQYPVTDNATNKNKKKKIRVTTTRFEEEEQQEDTSHIDTDQDSGRDVGTKQNKKISEQSEEVDSQQNDKYFQEDGFLENILSEGVVMDMENEPPISQSQEILYLEFRPLQTDKEDTLNSANLVTTELCGNSFDEENSMEQQEQSPPTDKATYKKKKKKSRVTTTRFEEEEQKEDASHIDSVQDSRRYVGTKQMRKISEQCEEVDSQQNDGYFQEDDFQENNQSEGVYMDMTNELSISPSQEILYFEYRSLQSDKEDTLNSANLDIPEEEQKEDTSHIDTDQDPGRDVGTKQEKMISEQSEEVDSQQNDEYFQEDDFRENNQSEGVYMDMTNELSISPSQEILSFEYRPLQRDKEDTWNSANVDTTELGGNSFDEENNMEQQEESPSTDKATNKNKKKKSRVTTRFEEEEQKEDTSHIDTDLDTGRDVGTKPKKMISEQFEEVNSQQNDEYFQEDDFQKNNQSEGVYMDMTNELPISPSQEIPYFEYRSLQRDKEDTRNSANMDTTELGGNSFDGENNMEHQEQSPATNQATNKKKKKKFRSSTTRFEEEEQHEDTSHIDSDRDSGIVVGTKQKRKISEQSEEVDSQQNDEYFQQDDFQENNQSEGVDMDMTNEPPKSQSQEILYFEYRPLQKDKADTWNSANMDTTQLGRYSFDEENNMEMEQQERSPATDKATRKKKKEKSRVTTSFEEEEQKEDTRRMTRAKKKISEQSQDEDGMRMTRAKKRKKLGIPSTSHEHNDDVDVCKEYPLLLPKSLWSTTQRINVHSNLDVISNIKNNLNKKQLNKFKRSCFGNFLDLKLTKFSSQLFYHLIRRQCGSKNRNELWFNLEGRIHKFGIKDFALITGLNCGELPAVDMSKIQKGKFIRRYFGGVKTIQRKKLQKIFLKMDKRRDKDVVKMAKLYILEVFILGKQKQTGINQEYALLIDDRKQFERYPWGRVSYEITVDFVKRAIKSRDAKAVGIGGFPYALLVWAYETIPLLGINFNFFAARISFGTPRMNNWVAVALPERKDLSNKVFESDSFDVQPIIATETELGMPYMSPFGGVKPSKEKNKTPLDQQHNKDNYNLKGPEFVSNDGVQNILLTKIVNLEENLVSLADDIVKMKDLFSKMWENVKEAADPENMRKP